jgi:thiamine pyrophosphate-dependent acetolactate synthase large subunit-like protein
MGPNVSDVLLDRLAAWGARRIYGYPGDGINGLTGAVRCAPDVLDAGRRVAMPPEGETRAVQIDIDGRLVGLRFATEVNPVGDSAATLRALLPQS